MKFLCELIAAVVLSSHVFTLTAFASDNSCRKNMTESIFRYPTTGNVSTNGFPEYLAQNLSTPRANIKLFAEELKQAFNLKNISLVNSGSSANLVAAAIAKEKMGKGHAIAAGFTFPTSISALTANGFEVSLADVEEGGFNISPKAILKAIRPDTKVLMVTHFLGFPAFLKEIRQIADQYNLFLIQDACESMNMSIDGVPIIEFGDVVTWSFYHPHHLSSYGGGAVITSSLEDFKLAESLTHWGRACSCQVDPCDCQAPPGLNHNFWYEREGFNVAISELNAAFGRFKLTDFDKIEQARKRNYTYYFEFLKEIDNIIIYPMPSVGVSPFVFPITLKSQDLKRVEAELATKGIEIRSLMGGSIANHPGFKNLPNDGLNQTNAIGARSFFVGIHQDIPFNDIKEVARILKEVFNK